jgi:Bax protein
MSADTRKRPARSAGGALPAFLIIVLAIAVLIVLAAVLPERPVTRPLPDFTAIEDVTERKRRFFAFLAPIVAAENRRVAGQRKRLVSLVEALEAGSSPGWFDRRWLGRLAEEYELAAQDPLADETLAELVQRVDTVPVPLALVQAATESAWGRSRFARRGNNLFGQWCYREGCGLVPAQRPAGASHEVAVFPSPRRSVRRYINNLNTHAAYAPLRAIRAERRAAEQPITAMSLTPGLIRYSERRQAYVDEVRAVVRQNRSLIEDVIQGQSDR